MSETPIESVDRVFIDDLWQRHLMFSRYVLREDWLTCFHIAAANRAQPLPRHAMETIAAGWGEPQ